MELATRNQTTLLIIYLFYGDLQYEVEHLNFYSTTTRVTFILYGSVHFINKNKVYYFCYSYSINSSTLCTQNSVKSTTNVKVLLFKRNFSNTNVYIKAKLQLLSIPIYLILSSCTYFVSFYINMFFIKY